MEDYKKTQTKGRKSPLNDLKINELRELVAWKGQESYRILSEVVMQGELVYSRDALLAGDLKKGDFIRLSERFKTFRSVLKIPDTAEKLLTKKDETRTAKKS